MMRILFLPIVLNLALAAAGVVCSASDSSIDVDFLCGAKGAGARLYAGQPYLLHVSLQGDNAQMLDDAVAGSLHLVGPLPHSRDYLGSFKADTVSGSIDVPIELEESGRYRVAMSLDGELLDCGGVEIEALPRPQMTSETCVAKEEELVGEEEEEEVCREGLSLTGEGVLEHRGPEAGEETAFVASWSASNTAPCGSVRRALSSHTGWELKFSRSHLGEGRGTKQKGDGDGEEVEVVLHPTVRSLGPLTLSFRYAAPTVAGRHTLLLCWTGDANGRSVCASPRRVDIAAGLVSVEKSAFYCPQAPAEHGDAEHSPSAVGGAIDAMDTLHSPREKGVDWRRAVREGLKRGMLVPAVSCSIFLRDAYGNDAGGRHGYSHRSDASRGLKIKVKVASTPGVPKPSIAEGESTTKPGVYTGKWQEVDIDLPWPSLRTSKLSYDQRDPESGVERKGGEDDEPAASCRGAHFEDGERLALCRPPPVLVADPEAKRPENWNDNDDGTWEARKVKNTQYASYAWAERLFIWNGPGTGEHVLVGGGIRGARVGEGAGSIERMQRWSGSGDGGGDGDEDDEGRNGRGIESSPPRGFFFAFRRIAGGEYLVRVSVNGKDLRMIVPGGRGWQGVVVDGV